MYTPLTPLHLSLSLSLSSLCRRRQGPSHGPYLCSFHSSPEAPNTPPLLNRPCPTRKVSRRLSCSLTPRQRRWQLRVLPLHSPLFLSLPRLYPRPSLSVSISISPGWRHHTPHRPRHTPLILLCPPLSLPVPVARRCLDTFPSTKSELGLLWPSSAVFFTGRCSR